MQTDDKYQLLDTPEFGAVCMAYRNAGKSEDQYQDLLKAVQRLIDQAVMAECTRVHISYMEMVEDELRKSTPK